MFSQTRHSISEHVRATSWKGFAMSHIGTVRQLNEDAFFIDRLWIGQHSLVFAMVCDGLGGLEKGDVASGWIMTGLSDYWYKLQQRLTLEEVDIDILADAFESELKVLHSKMYHYALGQDFIMGTTCSLILLWKDQLRGLHVGDSRIYVYHETLRRMTKDDSWVQNQIDRGLLTEEESMGHPRNHIITQCVGGQKQLYIAKINASLQGVNALLICTDGLYNACQAKDLEKCLKDYQNGDTLLEDLFEQILKRGAEDNLTAVLIKKNKGFFGGLVG